ncbi:pentapeptide repeat-containing protein [Holophaga foetida]|uniref:pentapeptide repeat-containing protein n=1 Tax=Holophaga foetida TaxID=35839 RepID=UPI000247213D|nr:pentapeptide repeat-containing protein [Holophaga foetida]
MRCTGVIVVAQYLKEQISLLRERWQYPLLSPDNGKPVEIDGAATFQELLTLRMAEIRRKLMECPVSDPGGGGSDGLRKRAREIWNSQAEAVISKMLDDLGKFGLPEVCPMEASRYQIRDSRDLRGASLRFATFRGAFLENMHFEGADISQACFAFSRCFETNFEDATCEGGDFSGAECHFAVFSRAVCDHLILDNADCTMVRFDQAVLRNASFHETTCFAAIFDRALLARADIADMKINHLTCFGRPGELEEARNSKPSSSKRKGEGDDWYIVDLFPAWLRAAQVNSQIRLLLRSNGFFLEADNYQYLEMVCKRHLLHQSLAKQFFEWFFKDLMFGYGLKWRRPLLTVLVVIALWGTGFALYFKLNSLYGLAASIGYGIYYSIIAFTTLGFGNVPDLEGVWPKVLLCSEALIGTVLMPLFLLAYARKILQD